MYMIILYIYFFYQIDDVTRFDFSMYRNKQ